MYCTNVQSVNKAKLICQKQKSILNHIRIYLGTKELYMFGRWILNILFSLEYKNMRQPSPRKYFRLTNRKKKIYRGIHLRSIGTFFDLRWC